MLLTAGYYPLFSVLGPRSRSPSSKLRESSPSQTEVQSKASEFQLYSSPPASFWVWIIPVPPLFSSRPRVGNCFLSMLLPWQSSLFAFSVFQYLLDNNWYYPLSVKIARRVSVSWLGPNGYNTFNKEDHQNAIYLNHITLTVGRFGFLKV